MTTLKIREKTSRFFTMLFASFFAAIASGCGSSWTTLREGQFQALKYALQSRTTHGPLSDVASVERRIVLGNMRPVLIHAQTTDWGPPWSTDIYATGSFLFLDTVAARYQNLPFHLGTIGVANTMLYIPPQTLNEAEYETFYDFMKAEWPAINAFLQSQPGRSFPNIIGLVYGTPQQFTQVFKGKHDGKDMRLVIENDGRVRLQTDDRYSQEMFSGLGQQVLMPGKRLLLNTNLQNGGLTRAELQTFVNQHSSPVTSYFTLVPVDYSALAADGVQKTAQLAGNWKRVYTPGTPQPPQPVPDKNFLWLRPGGIAGAIPQADGSLGSWSYDEVGQTVTVVSGNNRSPYRLATLTDTELILEPLDAGPGTHQLHFQRGPDRKE